MVTWVLVGFMEMGERRAADALMELKPEQSGNVHNFVCVDLKFVCCEGGIFGKKGRLVE